MFTLLKKGFHDKITKRVYRLFSSGNYKIKQMKDPLTGEDLDVIVSKYFVLYIIYI